MSQPSKGNSLKTPVAIGLSVVLILAVAFISFGCGTADTKSPEGVVKVFWIALGKNDQDTMPDCMEPSLRPGLDPFSQVVPPGTDWLVTLLQWLKTQTGKKFVELVKISYQELDNDGSIAHVQVSGRVKVSKDVPLIGGMVREFQLTHTLVKEGDEWYLTSPR